MSFDIKDLAEELKVKREKTEIRGLSKIQIQNLLRTKISPE